MASASGSYVLLSNAQDDADRLRSGYNSGESLALWDCDADVEVVHDDAGHLQDMALADPRILLRLGVELRWRQITVTTVPSSDCNECKKEPLAP